MVPDLTAASPAAAPPADRGDRGGPTVPWTEAYLRARQMEGRLYPDEVVARLPLAPAADPLRHEWLQRADSAARLVATLSGLPRPLVALEVGCGNGWLANRLAAIPGSDVTGLDVNVTELDQARRVFGDRPNLRFVEADALLAPPPAVRPNVIVLASVIQYVPDLAALVRRLEDWLAPGGEIHILDSPIYAPDDVPAARERTRRYYAELGVPEMAAVYRHHDWRALDGFRVDVLGRPETPLARLERRLLGRPRSPFPWLRIRPGARP